MTRATTLTVRNCNAIRSLSATRCLALRRSCACLRWMRRREKSAGALMPRVSFEKILIQDRDGNVSSLQQIIDTQRGVDKKPLILFTWANQWCGPCIGVLDVFYTKFPDYQKEYDLKLLALNLNDQNKNTQKELSQFLTSSSKKRPWLAHSYFDPNSSFTKFFNVSGAPSTLYFVGDRIYKSHGFYGEIGENELHAQTMEKILRYLSSI